MNIRTLVIARRSGFYVLAARPGGTTTSPGGAIIVDVRSAVNPDGEFLHFTARDEAQRWADSVTTWDPAQWSTY